MWIFKRQADGIEPCIYWPALMVGLLDAILFPVLQFTGLASQAFADLAIWGSTGVLLLVFVRVLVDPRIQRAVGAVNRDMGAVKRSRLALSDEEWGWFGTRWGSGHLSALRLVLLGEFLWALALVGRGAGPPAPLLLAIVGFGLLVVLTMSQMKVHAASTQEVS